MEESWTSRTELLIGKEGIEKLKSAKVIIYGIGGVGSFVVEGLARAGVGQIVLVDNDVITISNLNRQIHAIQRTVGESKVKVMRQRILDINPKAIVDIYMAQDIKEGEESLIHDSFSYVVDAVDTVKTKIKLIEKAFKNQIPIISCMGTGDKLDPTRFEIADIESTSVCPLARVMRKELKKKNIKGIKVLFSKEPPIQFQEQDKKEKTVPASISFVPSVAGLIIAGEVIKDIVF